MGRVGEWVGILRTFKVSNLTSFSVKTHRRVYAISCTRRACSSQLVAVDVGGQACLSLLFKPACSPCVGRVGSGRVRISRPNYRADSRHTFCFFSQRTVFQYKLGKARQGYPLARRQGQCRARQGEASELPIRHQHLIKFAPNWQAFAPKYTAEKCLTSLQSSAEE